MSARLSDMLIELAKRGGEPTPYGSVVRVTRAELARLVGAAEVTVIKTLTEFKQRSSRPAPLLICSTSMDANRELLTIMFAPLLGLAGATTRFYFGECAGQKSRR